MLKTRHACSIVTLLLVMLMSSAAWAATITGTVANNTGRTGRIYVVAESTGDSSRSFGTTLAAAGPFTISGVIPGTYRIEAFLDTRGTGIQHANDPDAVSANLTVAANATTVAAGTVALTAPTPVAVQAPTEVTVYGGNGVNYVKWVGPTDTDQHPIADRYTVEWSDTQGAVTGQSAEVRSGFEDNFLHRGGSLLYYRVTSHVGTSTASSEWIRVVTPPAVAGSITGTVSFTGGATGPLYVYAVNENTNPPTVRVAVVNTPSSPASYTIPSVPPGSYDVVAFLDQDANGSFEIGDAGMVDTNDFTPRVTVGTAQVTAPSIALESGSVATIITTGHGKSESAEWFNLVFTAQSMRKQIVGVTLSGPQLSQDVNIALQEGVRYGQFHTRIPMTRQIPGQTYTAVIAFADGTTETVTEQVTAVLDAFATPTAPVGNVAFNARPTLSWTQPSPAPSNYLYSLWMSDAAGANTWTVWELPSSTTSVTYGGPALQNGTTYRWIVNVTDSNGNMAAREVEFTPTSSAAINSITPAGGAAGTSVTIVGVNFPANPTVQFNGANAVVTAANGTSITATVPATATTGPVRILNGTTVVATSANPFVVGAPLSIRGVVQTSANAPVAGARVEMAEDPTRFTTTAADGSFTLQPLFRGDDVTLRITATGYVPTYSVFFDNLTASENLTPYPFHLYTQAQLNGWGVTAGRGMIAGHALNVGTTPYSPLASVTVTTTPSRSVNYLNGTTNSTAANGTFLVTNVPDQEYVTTTGARNGWTFYPSGFLVRAGSVTEGPLYGSLGGQPSIGNFTPASGKRGSTVTITGVNFSATPAENRVEFTAGPTTFVTANVTAATTTSLTVTVPPTAVTGPIRVTTAGVTATSAQTFTVDYTLAVTLTGRGTVNSDPSGIACSGTTGCSANFASGRQVTLFHAGEGGSTFSGWGGACTGTGACVVTMNADRAVTATFSSGSYIRIGTTLYSTLANALAAPGTSTRIQMQAMVFPATNLILEETATIVGGYDSSFTNQTGFTTLLGPVYVQNGELRVDRIIIR